MHTSSPITSRNYSFRNNSSVIERSLRINENRRKSTNSLFWGSVNLCLLCIITYDITHTCPINISYILYLEYILAGVFFLNTLYHFVRCFGISSNNETVPITPEQKQLLGIKDYDPNYTVISQEGSSFRLPSNRTTPNVSFSNTPMNMTAHSWRSNASSSNSPNYSLSSSSFSFVQGSPPSARDNRRTSHISPLHLSHYDSPTGEFINDEQSLTQYLKGYEIYEKTANSSSPIQQPVSLLSSFWSHPAAKANHGASSISKSQYQLSPLSSGSSSNSPSGNKADEKGSPVSNQFSGIEIWRQMHVNSFTLTQWNANIRMWLSQTIVERLVKEIEHIDDSIQKHGLSDVKVGDVGLDRLRKTAQMAPVLQFIPTLSTLLPFLEVTTNQEYLVKRIRELAKGGCMSDFKWNGGSSFNGKEWNDSLPTDAAIIMHLFVTYMDTQLLPLPNEPDVKPFSGYHYFKCTDKIPLLTPTTLAIHQANEKPPHFRVIAGEEIFEVVKGYNNLFHTLLLFLFQVNKREHGMLGQINLGRAGVNILWVIDS